MVKLIVGKEGKGKTKHLLDKVNEEIKSASGNIVFLDRSSKHMFELNNKVRLVDVSEYDFTNISEFVGFIYGILSSDHDIQQIYIDGIIKITKVDKAGFADLVNKLDAVSNTFKFDMIISASIDESELDDETKKKVIISL